MAKKERLKDFEIMTTEPQVSFNNLVSEICSNVYDLDYIRDLVVYGHFDIDVIWKDVVEWTCLLKASYSGKADIVKVLLEEGGADPNQKDKQGSTALHLASKQGHSQVVQEILKHPNIDPNLKDEGGSTALMGASERGRSQVVEELLKHPNIDPNLKTLGGYTALIDASGRGHSQVVQVLLSHPKINPNLQNREGNTALIRASSGGYSQIVREILKNPNTDISIENDEGLNAWDIARNKKYIREKFPELNPNNTKAINKTLEDKIILLKTICEGLCDTLPIKKQKEFKEMLDKI